MDVQELLDKLSVEEQAAVPVAEKPAPQVVEAPVQEETDVQVLLKKMVDLGAADIFIVAGCPISFKVHQRIENLNDARMFPDATEKFIRDIYKLARREMTVLFDRGDDDFSFALKGVSRFRINTYKQRGSFAAVIRVVAFSLPDPQQLHIPQEVLDLGKNQRGLVLVTGSSYSGKTTTLTCVLDEINRSRPVHIITLEDPIEYLHSHKNSVISQREISLDTGSYPVALRAALRQSPDVLLISELRDAEAISISLTAAETGHLVFSSLHTLGAANSIDRLVDAFPANQQKQIRMQLSMVLQTVVCQQLIPTIDGQVIPAFEIMHCNTAIRTLIRDGRTHQINSIIQSSAAEGMVSMDTHIAKLCKNGIIDRDEAIKHSLTPVFLLRQLGEEAPSGRSFNPGK